MYSPFWAKSSKLPAWAFLACLVLSMRADTATEYQVKAGFLYNFTKFVTWAPETSGSPHQLFSICTAAEGQWDRALDETLKGKTVGARTVVTRSVRSEKDAKNCQVLYVPASESPKWESLMAEARLPGVLTVAESNRDGKRGNNGAIITFVLEVNRVRFVINTKAAEKAGLAISSKLLSLALAVQQ